MKVINFYGSCTARNRLTLVSKFIKYAYKIKNITMTFPNGCNNLLQLSIHSSIDDSAPSNSAPNDPSIFTENSQAAYIVGNGTQKNIKHELDITSKGSFLKVHANNSDYYDHDVDVQIEIEPE